MVTRQWLSCRHRRHTHPTNPDASRSKESAKPPALRLLPESQRSDTNRDVSTVVPALRQPDVLAPPCRVLRYGSDRASSTSTTTATPRVPSCLAVRWSWYSVRGIRGWSNLWLEPVPRLPR